MSLPLCSFFPPSEPTDRKILTQVVRHSKLTKVRGMDRSSAEAGRCVAYHRYCNCYYCRVREAPCSVS